MSASATAKAVSWVKRTIGYPEDQPRGARVQDFVQPYTGSQFNFTKAVKDYIVALFPFFQWIGRYNLHWLTGDLIAGITVGIVLVPQSMSYAKIATLPPQYGLYSSFVGVFVYCFFATSKDVSIGPVAVMSLETSKIIQRVLEHHPNRWEGPQIATTTAFICGFIVLGIGLLRIGRIVELIPAPAVSGFMTGSAINIVAGQVPGLLGTSSLFNTRASTYLVIINTFKYLPSCTKDAAFGLFGLFALYFIRISLTYLTKRFPHRSRTFFFISICRNAFVIVVLTFASWLYVRHRADKKGNYPIQILKKVPRGFQHVGSPVIDRDLLKALAPDLPVATIILLLEHIAIGKSFGRVNGYKINPNQELIAIGVTNTVGTVFQAYPATGSFSRTALKSKSGVRTPAAGWFTGLVVIVALYGLTSAFFWIPNAGLSAIIIHAVADLVASPKQVYNFWRISPLECVIWWAAVLVTVFTTIEIGIYTSIIASLVLLVLRIMVPRGVFMGKVRWSGGGAKMEEGEVGGGEKCEEMFVPLDANEKGALPSDVKVVPPLPGVVIYRHEDGLLYPNSSAFNIVVVDYVKSHTRRGKDMSRVPLRDRPWNDPGPKRGETVDETAMDLSKPLLRAIVLDFSTVTHVDTTAVQNLVDTRVEVEKWADGPVEFHFAHILSPWIRRALLAGGFGIAHGGGRRKAAPYEVAPIVPPQHQHQNNDDDENGSGTRRRRAGGVGGDVEVGGGGGGGYTGSTSLKAESVSTSSEMAEEFMGGGGGGGGGRTPYFHATLAEAVRAAERCVEAATASGYGQDMKR